MTLGRHKRVSGRLRPFSLLAVWVFAIAAAAAIASESEGGRRTGRHFVVDRALLLAEAAPREVPPGLRRVWSDEQTALRFNVVWPVEGAPRLVGFTGGKWSTENVTVDAIVSLHMVAPEVACVTVDWTVIEIRRPEDPVPLIKVSTPKSRDVVGLVKRANPGELLPVPELPAASARPTNAAAP